MEQVRGGVLLYSSLSWKVLWSFMHAMISTFPLWFSYDDFMDDLNHWLCNCWNVAYVIIIRSLDIYHAPTWYIHVMLVLCEVPLSLSYSSLVIMMMWYFSSLEVCSKLEFGISRQFYYVALYAPSMLMWYVPCSCSKLIL